MTEQPDRLLTVQEVAERLSVPVSWVYERTRFDALPGMVRMGKYVRFSERGIEAFVAAGGEQNTEKENACEPVSSKR